MYVVFLYPPKHLVKHTLRTPNLTLPLLYYCRRMPDSNRQRFERTLRPMVIVVSSDAINMQRCPTGLGKALEAVRNHLCAQITNLLPLQPQIRNTVWAVAQVDNGAGQGLVEGCVCMAEARQACRALQGVLERGAEREEGVFGGVVIVDVQVALNADAQRPASVFGQRVDHVVEEADAGVDLDFLAGGLLCCMLFLDLLAFAVEILLVEGCPEVGVFVSKELAAVEVDGDLDFGLVGVFVQGVGARHFGGIDNFDSVSLLKIWSLILVRRDQASIADVVQSRKVEAASASYPAY